MQNVNNANVSNALGLINPDARKILYKQHNTTENFYQVLTGAIFITSLVAGVVAAVAIVVFAGILMGIVGGVSVILVGAGLTELTDRIKHRRLSQIWDMKDRFNNDTTMISQDNLIDALKIADTTARQKLINHMNFNQLHVAKDILGKSKFDKMIASATSVDHRMWQFIETLPKKNPNQLLKKIKSEACQWFIQNNPEFMAVLQEELSDTSDPQVLKHIAGSWLDSLKYELKDTDATITLRINEGKHTIVVNKTALSQNSNFFAGYEGFKEDQTTIVSIKEAIDDVPAFERFIRILEGMPVLLNQENIPDLLNFEKYFISDKLKDGIDAFIAANLSLYTHDELDALICNYALKNTWTLFKQNVFGEQNEGIKKDIKNLTVKLLPMAYRCGSVFNEREFLAICDNFVQTNRQALLANLPWAVEDMPKAIVEILYSTQ